MGAQISVSKNQFIQDAISQQRQVCPQTNCSNVISDVDIVIEDSDIEANQLLNQECNITVECLYNGSVSRLLDLVQEAVSNARGGLGFQVASASQYVELITKLIQEQVGAQTIIENRAQNVNFRITGSTVKLENGLLNQIGNAEVRQVFEAIAEEAVDISQKAQAEATGWDLFSFGGIAFLVFLAILAGIWMFGGKKKEKESTNIYLGTPSEGSIMKGGAWDDYLFWTFIALVLISAVVAIVGAIIALNAETALRKKEEKVLKHFSREGFPPVRQPGAEARNIDYYLRNVPPYY